MAFDFKVIEGSGGTGAESDEEALLRGFRGMAMDGAHPEVSPELERLGLAAIERGLKNERRRTARIWAVGAGLLAAAGVLFALTIGATAQPDATLSESKGVVETLSHGSSEWLRLTQGSPLSDGARLRTSDASSARLVIRTDTKVQLQSSTELALAQGDSNTFSLTRGSALFSVAQLREGEVFWVVAQGTTIEVREAQFSVTILEENAAPCIVITSGAGKVAGPRGRALLKAGERSGCELPREEVAAPEAPKPVIMGTAQPTVKSASVSAKSHTSVPRLETSTLSEQNELFQKALIAERSGRTAEARQLLDSFVAKYPNSPLLAQVRAQRTSLNEKK